MPIPKKVPTLENILTLFKHRIRDFKGESQRSYQKALTSFQYYVAGNYSLPHQILNNEIVENWVIDNRIQGLTEKTTAFYLDKIASLYGAIAENCEGEKSSLFKDLKKKLRISDFSDNYHATVNECVEALNILVKKHGKDKLPPIFKLKKDSIPLSLAKESENMRKYWGCLALSCGLPGNLVASILQEIPSSLNILALCRQTFIEEKEREYAFSTVSDALLGEPLQWFAMRLRPTVTFSQLIDRFTKLSKIIKMPELFYPCEEIAIRIGRKIIWKGRPVIRDIVFFKYKITDIYSLFNHIHDMAWCYKNTIEGTAKYAAIPTEAMEDFRKAIGFLGPGYEITAAGEMELKPGDEVVILSGDYARQHAKILKSKSSLDNENVVYRVGLMDQNGHWDIGIDARLLRKIK